MAQLAIRCRRAETVDIGMRIDPTHRPWVIASLIIFVGATSVYVPYAISLQAARGGSALGLLYGIIGYAFMLFAGLLAARKKVRAWRIGRAQTWMRGHLWLGLLSLPMILFHAGFAWRGPLTFVLMILFFIVIASGILGAILQHYLPSLMTQQVPAETIHEDIPNVCKQLRAEAEQLVVSICATMQKNDELHFRIELASAKRAPEVFESLRRTLPIPLHTAIAKLENIFQEERQLSRQMHFHRLLHAWLIVHAPVSIALLVFGGIHAIFALRY